MIIEFRRNKKGEQSMGAGKTITISEVLEKRIYDFCMDELNYHIHESGCAEDYESEILAQIELLKLLGYKEQADDFSSEYLDYLSEM